MRTLPIWRPHTGRHVAGTSLPVAAAAAVPAAETAPEAPDAAAASVPVIKIPATLTQTAAFYFLDEAWGNLTRALGEGQFDCGDCRASGTGWCEADNGLYLASEVLGQAKARVRACLTDRAARDIAAAVTERISDKAAYGLASETAFGIVTAGGVK